MDLKVFFTFFFFETLLAPFSPQSQESRWGPLTSWSWRELGTCGLRSSLSLSSCPQAVGTELLQLQLRYPLDAALAGAGGGQAEQPEPLLRQCRRLPAPPVPHEHQPVW